MARLGDGWLGIWVSPRRYATVRDHITREASEAGDDESAIAAVVELRTLLTASPKR